MIPPDGARPLPDEEPLGRREEDEGDGARGEAVEQTGQARAPWHFKVIVVGSVVYLGYRLYQGIGWLVHHV